MDRVLVGDVQAPVGAHRNAARAAQPGDVTRLGMPSFVELPDPEGTAPRPTRPHGIEVPARGIGTSFAPSADPRNPRLAFPETNPGAILTQSSRRGKTRKGVPWACRRPIPRPMSPAGFSAVSGRARRLTRRSVQAARATQDLRCTIAAQYWFRHPEVGAETYRNEMPHRGAAQFSAESQALPSPLPSLNARCIIRQRYSEHAGVTEQINGQVRE